MEVFSGIELGQTQQSLQDSLGEYGIVAQEFSTQKELQNLDDLLSNQIYGMVSSNLKVNDISSVTHLSLLYPNFYYDDFNLTRLVALFGHKEECIIDPSTTDSVLYSLSDNNYYYFDQSMALPFLDSIYQDLFNRYGVPDSILNNSWDTFFELTQQFIKERSESDNAEGTLYLWLEEYYSVELFSGIPNHSVEYHWNVQNYVYTKSDTLNSDEDTVASQGVLFPCRSYSYLRFELNAKGKAALGLE